MKESGEMRALKECRDELKTSLERASVAYRDASKVVDAVNRFLGDESEALSEAYNEAHEEAENLEAMFEKVQDDLINLRVILTAYFEKEIEGL